MALDAQPFAGEWWKLRVYLLSGGAFFPACTPGIQPLLPQGAGDIPDAGVLAEGLAKRWFSLWR